MKIYRIPSKEEIVKEKDKKESDLCHERDVKLLREIEIMSFRSYVKYSSKSIYNMVKNLRDYYLSMVKDVDIKNKIGSILRYTRIIKKVKKIKKEMRKDKSQIFHGDIIFRSKFNIVGKVIDKKLDYFSNKYEDNLIIYINGKKYPIWNTKDIRIDNEEVILIGKNDKKYVINDFINEVKNLEFQ